MGVIMSVFMIGEIGINHNGNLELAKKLIDAAAEAGCNAVKFQKRTVEAVYTKEFLDSPRESPWGTTQRAQKMGLEFGVDAYREIDRYCKALGIAWFASAWDTEAQMFLRQFELRFNKVASAMLTNHALLKVIAEEGKYTYISTGMSTIGEIDMAVKLFKSYHCPFELLHCNSTYPMEETDANLLTIRYLQDRYSCNVGYSGHETGKLVCICAVSMGATSIERHITLDRTMYGSDQKASIEPHELRELVAEIRKVETIRGTYQKVLTDGEKVIRKKLRG